eukprot:TRINITY_DN1327_c0_g1_i3.p1 TRINITY_DN1327_c0_g1~~TRINITY_DN1327_c0_g1_i3.p1  ORF type:complete len:106 (-),score=26.58 TRINITY_DN1327_c0_g1_i3:125-442(-)
MIHGHYQYAKGATEESIGNLIGSPEWQESGKRDKDAAVQELRAANATTDQTASATAYKGDTNSNSTTSSVISGSLEKNIGKAVGCQGMVHNGEQKEAVERQENSK